MMYSINHVLKYTSTIFFWMKLVTSISPTNNLIYSADDSIGDIVDHIASKGYLPNEKELSTYSLVKNNDNDATYLLSKLTDEALVRLLNEQPQRTEYNLNDIMRVAISTKIQRENRLNQQREIIQDNNPNILEDLSMNKKRFYTVTNNEPLAYYRLNNRPVESNTGQNSANYRALQKLKSLLNIYMQPRMENNSDENEDKKQLIFDILVAQLKTLCCKSSKKSDNNKSQYKPLLNELLPSSLKQNTNTPNHLFASYDPNNKYTEFMFLIINDEIKSNISDELIDVDPESLDGNSSVLLLGPVTSPLTDDQLKLVMSRISNELTKPEYASLLQQLSSGMLTENYRSLMKDFVFGHKTRRYIKPHRCNHQSKLAKVYGGPKWIVCTGYLNLNKPSLYD